MDNILQFSCLVHYSNLNYLHICINDTQKCVNNSDIVPFSTKEVRTDLESTYDGVRPQWLLPWNNQLGSLKNYFITIIILGGRSLIGFRQSDKRSVNVLGLLLPNQWSCERCDTPLESVNHIMILCPLAKLIWTWYVFG